MLVVSLVLLLPINLLQKWASRRQDQVEPCGRGILSAGRGGIDNGCQRFTAEQCSGIAAGRESRHRRIAGGALDPDRHGLAVSWSVSSFCPWASFSARHLPKGFRTYWDSLRQPDALAAIRLTLLAAGIAVPLNLVFGVAAAWAIGKFQFKGRSLLITLIDLPLSVSPVVSGLIYVLLFGLARAAGALADPA